MCMDGRGGITKGTKKHERHEATPPNPLGWWSRVSWSFVRGERCGVVSGSFVIKFAPVAVLGALLQVSQVQDRNAWCH